MAYTKPKNAIEDISSNEISHIKKTDSLNRNYRKGITTRSIIIGLLIAICHTCWIVYEETALGHTGGTAAMLMPSVIGILFLITVLNSILKRTIPSWMFSPSEMMVIFSMVTISAFISGFDLLQNLFPVLLWPYYFNTPSAGYNKYFHFIPDYFIPKDNEVIKAFFLGSQDFWHFFRPEIFNHWIIPLLFWGTFLFLLAFTMLCLSSILRRQWVDREKLLFPIIELPMMMVKENTAGSLLRNPLLLTGFGITVFILSLNCLSALYPSIPGIRLNVMNIGRIAFPDPPLNGMNPIFTSWSPFAIGLSYLMPLDISFSCWFFYVIIRLSCALATAQGWRDPNAGLWVDQFPHFQRLAEGAWIGMFFVVMWSAKGHLIQIYKTAMGGEKIPGDEKEPIPYRLAFFGAVGGFLLLNGISIISGLRPHIALMFFSIYFLAIIVMTRIYAQVATSSFELSFFSGHSLLASFVGNKGLTQQDSTILTDFHWFDRTYRPHPMGHELESMVFADKQGQKMRTMTYVILIAVIAGIIVGMLTTLQIYYDRGAASAKVLGHQVNVGAEGWTRLTVWETNQTGIQFATILKVGISTLIVFLLAFARSQWFGFPLNPIGYAFASSYAMEYIWNIILVTWLVKLIIIRYGGLNLYRKSLYFFFGIALGDALIQVIWGLVMTILGIRDASPYLPVVW